MSGGKGSTRWEKSRPGADRASVSSAMISRSASGMSRISTSSPKSL